MRGKRVCEMPNELQEFLEDYIPEFIPAGKIVCCWLAVVCSVIGIIGS